MVGMTVEVKIGLIQAGSVLKLQGAWDAWLSELKAFDACFSFRVFGLGCAAWMVLVFGPGLLMTTAN